MEAAKVEVEVDFGFDGVAAHEGKEFVDAGFGGDAPEKVGEDTGPDIGVGRGPEVAVFE